MPARHYLQIWFAFTACFVTLAAVVNLLVDPYGVYHIVELDGFNRVKSRASQRVEVFKRHGVRRMHPNAIVLGNSRAEVGFDPDARGWPVDALPVYNRAIAGSGVVAAVREFRSTLCTVDPHFVVMGVDFLDFRTDRIAATESLPVMKPDCSVPISDHISALLTGSALIDSIWTVKSQRDSYSPNLTDAGFNPMHDYLAIARREGYATLFLQKNREYAKTWALGPKDISYGGAEFGALDSLLADAARRGIAVRLVIYPYHAQGLVLFYHAGFWPAFENWKREVTRRVEAHAAEDVELWDFSGFGPYADERVPTLGDTRTEMRWYWEAGHFKKALGDIVLARIFSTGQGTWGRRLTSQNIDEHLRQQRKQRDDYFAMHRPEVDSLETLIVDSTRDRKHQ